LPLTHALAIGWICAISSRWYFEKTHIVFAVATAAILISPGSRF
jgi:hypothetical protein